ncbi:hypothetical protein [Pseudonocardia broussonetiae]|nr:hypothetical protein [Pseudonocardia broussonetiae]
MPAANGRSQARPTNRKGCSRHGVNPAQQLTRKLGDDDGSG